MNYPAIPIYPDIKNFCKIKNVASNLYGVLTQDELDTYHKALTKYHCHRYASELTADGMEIYATQLAEYAVDCMYEDDNLPASVYDWLADDTHFVWDVALEVQEDWTND